MAKPRFSLNGDGDDKHDVARTLQLKFDELNELWSRAEAQLRRIPIPVDVSVEGFFDAGPGADPELGFNYSLGYVNVNDGCRICYVTEYESSPDPRDEIPWKPISDCPAEVRVRMVRHLDELRSRVLAEADKYVGTLDSAIAELSGTLDAWDK